MNKMVWFIILQLGLGLLLQGQYKEYPKLQKLFEAGKYDKCIKKAEGYAKKDTKEPIPSLYMMKCWLAIAEDDGHEKYKSALNKALAAARKTSRKDKDDKLYTKFEDDYNLLYTLTMARADGLVKEGKCGSAISLYDRLYQLYGDRESSYKKSICMLADINQQKDGFTLLRNTMLGVYKDYKTENYITEIPQGFAQLSKEYLARGYFFNADDILKKGIEVFPNDTAIQNEMMRQLATSYSASITSDFTKDLMALHNKLLWVDSCYSKYPPVVAMLKQTNEKIITQQLKYDTLAETVAFIRQCYVYDSIMYRRDSVDTYLISLYNNSDMRRIEGALDSLTRLLIDYNTPAATTANTAPARYVFNYLLKQNNYEVAAYFVKQSKNLYPKDKKMQDDMQASLEKKLVELLSAAPVETASLDLAEKFTLLAPANKKLPEVEKGIYYKLLKTQADSLQYSLFFTTVNRGLGRFKADPVMMKQKKEMAIKDFTQNYTPNLIGTFGEMHVVYHVTTCTPGKVDSLANRKFTGLLNYLRRQAGVYDSCFLDAELNEMAQQAALMMKARNELNHYPDSSWKCFSQKGKRAAGSSNLSLGAFGTDALLGQVEDDGANNIAVGHRRWVLNPYCKVFGHGSTDYSMALYVFGKFYNNPAKDRLPAWNKDSYVSWPPRDFAPESLLPLRWSFSLEDADFSKAKVKVTKKGRPVKIKPEEQQQGFGLNTLVWKMEETAAAGDIYTITVSGVAVLGKTATKDYTYTIEVLDL